MAELPHAGPEPSNITAHGEGAERLRVQALLDEMQLQQSGAVDQATGVRGNGNSPPGGTAGSGQIQQTGDNLRVDAAIVDVPNLSGGGSTAK